MARAPVGPKQVYLYRLFRAISLPRSLEDDLNPELPHVKESAPTLLRRRPHDYRPQLQQHIDLWTDPP